MIFTNKTHFHNSTDFELENCDDCICAELKVPYRQPNNGVSHFPQVTGFGL